ncbi:MAG TPA: type II secretion system F family protein [Phycisphaerales bacterium]|nr:type II secretion system F family protein [Phycisphaerales bacterium]HRQ75809.1 type II secretion system F family protein [Phycisphaerales bacterium]
MGTFAYVARDNSGQRITGKVAAPTEQAVLAELHARQLSPVRVEEVHERTLLKRRLSSRQLAQAYRQMADLLRAGVPLLRAIKLLGRSKSNPLLAKVMTEVADEVAEGSRLADAMAARGDMFPPIQVAMVRAGERGGFLEPVLSRMGTFLEHQADMRSKVMGNLIYPFTLMIVGGGILLAAMIFFVPQFRGFYSRIEVPLPTRMLLGISDFLVHSWFIALACAVLAVAGAWWALRQPRIRRAIAVGQLRIPKYGPLVQGLAVARFTRILGTLLENGIPMLNAMQISRDAAGHMLLAEAIDNAAEAVRAGEPLAQPLAESGMFSEDVVEMIAVGESANNLPVVLITIAETIEKRVDRMLGVFVRLVEPLLLLALAGAVAFMFIALVLPMMRLSTSV